jgi:hypothetical protein
MRISLLIAHDKLNYHVIGAYKKKEKALDKAHKLNQQSEPLNEKDIEDMIFDVTSFYDNVFKKQITKEEALQLIDEFVNVRYHVKDVELHE